MSYTDQCTIHIGNLPLSVTEHYLRMNFQRFGIIQRVTLIENKKEDSSQCAFILFSTPEEAKNAAQKHYYQIENRTITVSPYKKDFKPIPEANIFIKNIDESITETTLEDVFKSFGPIISIKIPRSDNGKTHNIAYIQFESPKDAQMAIKKMNGAAINDRAIEIGLFKPTGIAYFLLIRGVSPEVSNSNDLHRWLASEIGQKNGSLLTDLKGIVLIKFPNNDISQEGLFSFSDPDTCQAVYNLLSAKRNIEVQKLSFVDQQKYLARNSQAWENFKEKTQKKESVKKCIYVLNLPSGITEADLKEYFSEAGHVHQVTIRQNARGTAAFIAFSNNEEQKAAIKQSIFMVIEQSDGKYLQLNVSRYKVNGTPVIPALKKKIAYAKTYIQEKIVKAGADNSLLERKGQLSDDQILAMYDDPNLLRRWIETAQPEEESEEEDS